MYGDDNGNGLNDEGLAIAGVTITLAGTNDLGETVYLTTTTDGNGYYAFLGLRPGTYTLHEAQPVGFDDSFDQIGTQGGLVDSVNDLLYDIHLAAGVDGLNNNFTEVTGGPANRPGVIRKTAGPRACPGGPLSVRGEGHAVGVRGRYTRRATW